MQQASKSYHIHDGQIKESDPLDPPDYELLSPSHLTGTHINLIPLGSAVTSSRLFYGARFMNQALPLVDGEAPYVQNMDMEDGVSFDKKMGSTCGALHASKDGKIVNTSPTHVEVKYKDGEAEKIPIYDSFNFNRKSAITQTPVLKPGDKFKSGQLLAKSNFTDAQGNVAMGKNLLTGLIPFKGLSMDDSIILSHSAASKLTSQHDESYDADKDDDTKYGKGHFTSLFPMKFKKDQLKYIDEEGIVKPGTVLHPGDPIMLATRPKTMTSATTQLGKLSKVMQQARSDGSMIWDSHVPGVVSDVVKNKDGYKVKISSKKPLQKGDKVVFRSGQKGIVSQLIPDDQMPRMKDGTPLEVLQNQLGIPSRVNPSMVYELLLGKVVKKKGSPIVVPTFLPEGHKWYDYVKKHLDENGVPETEEVFDPVTGKKMENPITVGYGHMLKLHHIVEGKLSARGQGSYSLDLQPVRGGGATAQAKRISGLETAGLMSSGAYGILQDTATVRGQRNDEYWQSIRQGLTPKPVGKPFVWDKFKALIEGAGLHSKSLPDGVERLGPMTDKHLEAKKPMEVTNGESVDTYTMQPRAGGVFDPTMVAGQRWGYIKLPHKLVNPSQEKNVCKLLGLTEKDFRKILAGEMELHH